MAGLLLSVRNATEARIALRGGASIVDVKEPLHGSLGAAPPRQWNAIHQLCAGRVPMSIALGELLEPELAARLSRLPNVAFAKIGLAGCLRKDDWKTRWLAARERLPRDTKCVAVAYVDWKRAESPAPDAVVSAAEQLGCSAILWDTYEKSSGDLFAHWSPEQLSHSLRRARAAAMTVVLAGSLNRSSLPQALSLRPDYIAVRGAACETSRRGPLSLRRIESLRGALVESSTSHGG